MIAAFVQALDALSDARVRRVMWLSVAAAALVFALLWLAVDWVLTETTLFATPWLEWLLDLMGRLATLVLVWLLFPAVVSAVLALMLEWVAAAVEARHYPGLPPAPGQGMGRALVLAARFLGLLLACNLLILPLLLIPPLWPVFPFVFYAVNGYLLGREYFELVAFRRLAEEPAARLRRAHRGAILLFGVATAFLLTVPVANLVAPVVATAAMVHLLEGWRAPGARRGGPGRQ